MCLGVQVVGSKFDWMFSCRMVLLAPKLLWLENYNDKIDQFPCILYKILSCKLP